MEMFEEASRRKIRFDSSRGLLSVEDLWDLPLTGARRGTTLDDIAIDLSQRVRDTVDTVSFVNPSAEDSDKAELALKFEVVKHIIRVRVAERDELRAAADRREKKQKLLELIARKQDDELAGKSVDELRVLAESL